MPGLVMTTAPCAGDLLGIFRGRNSCQKCRHVSSAGHHLLLDRCRRICAGAGHVRHASGAGQLPDARTRRPGQSSPVRLPGRLRGPSAAAPATSMAFCGIWPTIPSEPSGFPAAPPGTSPWLCGSLTLSGGRHGAAAGHSRGSRAHWWVGICRAELQRAGLARSGAARLTRSGATRPAGQSCQAVEQPNWAAQSASPRSQWLSA